jgi:predicted ATP-grasp superfamily ATP-dependent carboligase
MVGMYSGIAQEALALVMGDVDLVRALGLAGIPCAFFGEHDDPARYSRHVRTVLPWLEHRRREDELVAALRRFGRAQREPPVLYPQTDAALLLVSRHRESLREAFRFVLADAELIDQLVDKSRFQALAERYGLPVPAADRVDWTPGRRRHVPAVSFPAVVKPAVREHEWAAAVAEGGKAVRVGGPDEWAGIVPQLAALGSDVVVQELVTGPETAIESYHAYVDENGTTVAAFTGRKIRTFPPRYGFSTAVEIVDLGDVAALGSDVLARLGLRGVAKVDFKRDERGRLRLLEVNPRFTLWHHPAAVAGVNVPALVHADLTGRPRPPGRRPVRQVAWCNPLSDLRTAYQTGMSPLAWLRWAGTCQAMSGLSCDDPLPFILGTLRKAVSRRVRRRLDPRGALRAHAA